MKLWTIQPVEVVKILEQNGVFSCDTSLSVNYDELKDAYQWMVQQMDKQNIPHPPHLNLPLWAWHTRNWKHKKPDFREKLKGKGIHCACIEFEIPDEMVLLSDEEHWHFVLNDMWLSDAKNVEELDALDDWFDSLTLEEQQIIKEKSWEKVFDVEPYDDNWDCKGRYVQATFWELRLEMVRDIKYFISK